MHNSSSMSQKPRHSCPLAKRRPRTARRPPPPLVQPLVVQPDARALARGRARRRRVREERRASRAGEGAGRPERGPPVAAQPADVLGRAARGREGGAGRVGAERGAAPAGEGRAAVAPVAGDGAGDGGRSRVAGRRAVGGVGRRGPRAGREAEKLPLGCRQGYVVEVVVCAEQGQDGEADVGERYRLDEVVGPDEVCS